MKRQHPDNDAPEPQEKIYLTERMANKNNQKYMDNVYELTRSKLYNGSRQQTGAPLSTDPNVRKLDFYCHEEMEEGNSEPELEQGMQQKGNNFALPMHGLKDNKVRALIKNSRRSPTPPVDKMALQLYRQCNYQQLRIDTMMGQSDGGKFIKINPSSGEGFVQGPPSGGAYAKLDDNKNVTYQDEPDVAMEID